MSENRNPQSRTPEPHGTVRRQLSWLDIRVGQIWRSKDKRDNGATRTIVEAPTGQMGYVLTTRAG